MFLFHFFIFFYYLLIIVNSLTSAFHFFVFWCSVKLNHVEFKDFTGG